MTDDINGIDWTELKKNITFVFFPVSSRENQNQKYFDNYCELHFKSMDSPGGDYLIADQFKEDASKLRTACLKTRRCLGNTMTKNA